MRKSRRRPKERHSGSKPQTDSKQIAGPSAGAGCLITLAFVGGILLVVLALMMCSLSLQQLSHWLYCDEYLETQMEVLSFEPHGDPATAQVRVLADGAVFSTSQYGSYLSEPVGPGRIIGIPLSPNAAKGRLIPIRYRAGASTWFVDLRIQLGHGPPPTVAAVAGCLALQAGFLIAGAWMTRAAYREMKKLPLDPKVDYD